MIRREHFRVAMTVLARRRHEGRKPTHKLVRGQGDHASRVRSRRLLLVAARPDPLPALVPRERVADALRAVVAATDDREPFEDERGPSAVSHEMLEGLAIGTHFGA